VGLPAENEGGYRLSFPVHFAANLKAPLMIVHNIGDDIVLFQKAGKQDETLIDPRRCIVRSALSASICWRRSSPSLSAIWALRGRGGGLIPTTRYAAAAPRHGYGQ
jgi:hypothetical protein